MDVGARRRTMGAWCSRHAATGAVLAAAFGILLGPGCVVDEDPFGSDSAGTPDPCEGVACSRDGECRADESGVAECFCDPGFIGDPYALRGCQPVPTGQSCDQPCGINATCALGGCVCSTGFVAVCGTGDCLSVGRLCDGQLDCANGADEDITTCAPAAVQEWILTDDCNDGLDARVRLWAQDRDWVWPSPTDQFVTDGFGYDTIIPIECSEGELICFGAQAGDVAWGVGIDGDLGCTDCCATCSPDLVDMGFLACD